MPCTVLMVAEKPSLADSIAHHLSHGQAAKRSRAVPVFEYHGRFQGQAAFFKVTSTTGHIYGCDFTSAHQSWDRVDEDELFDADTVKKESGGKVVSHLGAEAHGCDYLVLWLDCDREGENICFEVMHVVRRAISDPARIFRAKFSAITTQEIQHAMDNLGRPNRAVSDAVECRQELDLKVGCAFTRFQTKYFHGKYGDLDASVVSYGPCQTPTLGFVVQRHDEIMTFKPEPFWRLAVTSHQKGVAVPFEWARGRVFDEPVARLLLAKVSVSKVARVTHASKGVEKRPRPQALNTVELLKVASRLLGIGPQQCMHVAEYLYTSGYMSYPRTESTAYPPSFDLDGPLRDQRRSNIWGAHVQDLLDGRRVRPKAGTDVGDHPPITPMRFATPGELSGDEWRIYEYVVRHFIATLSPDCSYTRTRITLDLHGEAFNATGRVVDDPGFTVMLPSLALKEERLPEAAVGDQVHLSDVRLQAGQTRPPPYLSEADLIGLMERHGIGTDASIPTHIQNICNRNYAGVKPGRTMEPTKLGIILIHGIQSIDPELVLPMVRSQVEAYVTQIAEGRAEKAEVLRYALDLFHEKFAFFRGAIERMDGLMEASFSKLASTGQYLTRCGVCSRYMRHFSTRPQRLYCQTCNATFPLPQGGAIKQYQNSTCPLDGFELVVCHVDGGRSLVICPCCYNNPPFENGGRANMTCSECTHPSCREALTANYVCDCIDDHCGGAMAFVVKSTGKWKVCCNRCTMMLMLPPQASRVRAHPADECPECGASMMSFTFPERQSPLATRDEKYTGCLFCSPLLRPIVQEVRGRIGTFSSGVSRGRGGRGRGRGGRGRGRGRQ